MWLQLNRITAITEMYYLLWQIINIFENIFENLLKCSSTYWVKISLYLLKFHPLALTLYWLSMNIKSVKSESEVAQLCLTLCDPMDCSLPGFTVHGIFQARILEWVATAFSKRSSWPRDGNQVSHIAGKCFTLWATKICSSTQYFSW